MRNADTKEKCLDLGGWRGFKRVEKISRTHGVSYHPCRVSNGHNIWRLMRRHCDIGTFD